MRSTLGFATIFCSFSISAFAAAPSDIADLVGSRATRAESEIRARGYEHVGSTWWNDETGTCVTVHVENGRYSRIDRVKPSTCGQFRCIAAGCQQRPGSRSKGMQPPGRSISERSRWSERCQSGRANWPYLAADDGRATLHSQVHSYGFRTGNSNGSKVSTFSYPYSRRLLDLFDLEVMTDYAEGGAGSFGAEPGRGKYENLSHAMPCTRKSIPSKIARIQRPIHGKSARMTRPTPAPNAPDNIMVHPASSQCFILTRILTMPEKMNSRPIM